MFITSKNKYLSNDMKIFGTCSIPLTILEYDIFTDFRLHENFTQIGSDSENSENFMQ